MINTQMNTITQTNRIMKAAEFSVNKKKTLRPAFVQQGGSKVKKIKNSWKLFWKRSGLLMSQCLDVPDTERSTMGR